MMRLGKIAVCLAGGLVLAAGLRAQESSLTNNPVADTPYAPIVVRNVFGIVPPPPPVIVTNDPAKDLPKITLNGIYSVFDRTKAMFKVSGVVAQPGQPPKDKYYNLSEGEGQDDIEVVRIDSRNSIVTFSNHGVKQDLPLITASASGGPAPAAPAPGAKPVKTGVPGPNGITTFSGHGPGPNAGIGVAADAGANAGIGMNFGGTGQHKTYQPTEGPQPTSLEAQVLQMEYNRSVAQQNNSPEQFLIPPTPITPPSGQ